MKKLLFLLLLLVPAMAQGDVLNVRGTTNIEDTQITEVFTDNAYGGAAGFNFTVAVGGASDCHILIRVLNLSSLLPANSTISACICSLYCYAYYNDDNISAYRVFKPWVEGTEDGADDDDGDATWNDWASDANEWGTEGCLCADDDGVDNSSDDGTCANHVRADRKATAEGDAVSVTGTGWYVWTISAELAQAWYDETAESNGIVLVGTLSGINRFYSTENYTDASKAPSFTFTYTTEGEEAVGQVIIIGAKDNDKENYHRPCFGSGVPDTHK
jgi:hypothetical protein